MRALLDLLVPPRCDGCGVVAPPPWCDTCDEVARAARPGTPCDRCAGPDAPDHACWAADAPVARTVALTRWRDPVARAVLRAKLAGRGEVFRALGPRLAAAVTEVPDVVVAVPTDPRRARQRGRDHAAVLGGSVAAALDRPLVRPLRVGRRREDRGQVGHAVTTLAADAFVASRRATTVEGRHVLLVDDVLTTGATAVAAAHVLRGLGATGVDLAVVARAGRHPLGS